MTQGDKPQGLMGTEALAEARTFAELVNLLADQKEVADGVQKHIPRLLRCIAAQDARIAELQEESDYQSHAIEVLAAALPHDAARQLLTEGQ